VLTALGLVLGAPSLSKADFIVQLLGPSGSSITLDYNLATNTGTVTTSVSGVTIGSAPTFTETGLGAGDLAQISIAGSGVTVGGINVTLTSYITTSGLEYNTINSTASTSGTLTVNTAVGGDKSTFSSTQLVTMTNSVSTSSVAQPFTAALTSYAFASNASFFGAPSSYTYSSTGSSATASETVTGVPANGSPTTTTFSGAGLYSLSNQLIITYSGAGSANVTANTVVSNSSFQISTPAPSSAIMAAAGMPVFGLLWLVRRRRAKNESFAPAIA